MTDPIPHPLRSASEMTYIVSGGALNSTHSLTHPIPGAKIRRICINLRNNLWLKWGGHIHPSPHRGDAPDWQFYS